METKEPRQYSLVKLKDPVYDNFDDRFIYLGKIPNKVMHCVVLGYDTNRMYVEFHSVDFVELSEEEI